MSDTEIRNMVFDHIIDGPEYRFVSVTIDGKTRNLRIYTDGRVEVYEGGRFVQLPWEVGQQIRLALGQIQHRVPTFEIYNGERLPATP